MFLTDYGSPQKGDRVLYKYSAHSWVWGYIVEINPDHQYPYTVYLYDKKTVYKSDSYGIKYIPWWVGYIDLNALECECGAKYTKNSHQHSVWCKLYKPVN